MLEYSFPNGASGKEPACQCTKHNETWVQSLGREDPLEKEMATHSSILAWRIPWTEEPGRLQSMGSRRVGHDWATSLSALHTCIHSFPNSLPIPMGSFFNVIKHMQHKTYHFNCVKVHGSVAVNTLILLCNHHHYLFPELSHPKQKLLYLITPHSTPLHSTLSLWICLI